MSLEAEVKKFGAKGAVLKYIHETNPSIPIEPFVLVPVGAKWREYSKDIEKLGDCLVRSSSPLEDGQRVSFAGLFRTEKYMSSGSVNLVLDSVRGGDVRRYARVHGIEESIKMALVFQRDSSSEFNWSMLRHPHVDKLLFVMGRPRRNPYRDSDNYVFDENAGTLEDVAKYERYRTYGRKPETKGMLTDLKKAIEIYKTIESMPAFQTGFVYQMEFGIEPFSVYQFRPFRKKEVAGWKLKTEKLGYVSYHKYSICFGITPPEGYNLKLVRSFNADSQKKICDLYHYELAGKFTKEGIIEKIVEAASLSPEERVYAEQVERMDKNTRGHNETVAFENALMRLNRTAVKDETCLYQEDMHFHYGRGNDLVFPNAKVWLPQGALQFLSHDWFRALQHYDVSLVSYNMMYGKTGDRVKVFSDGLKGLVVELK